MADYIPLSDKAGSSSRPIKKGVPKPLRLIGMGGIYLWLTNRAPMSTEVNTAGSYRRQFVLACLGAIVLFSIKFAVQDNAALTKICFEDKLKAKQVSEAVLVTSLGTPLRSLAVNGAFLSWVYAFHPELAPDLNITPEALRAGTAVNVSKLLNYVVDSPKKHVLELTLGCYDGFQTTETMRQIERFMCRYATSLEPQAWPDNMLDIFCRSSQDDARLRSFMIDFAATQFHNPYLSDGPTTVEQCKTIMAGNFTSATPFWHCQSTSQLDSLNSGLTGPCSQLTSVLTTAQTTASYVAATCVERTVFSFISFAANTALKVIGAIALSGAIIGLPWKTVGDDEEDDAAGDAGRSVALSPTKSGHGKSARSLTMPPRRVDG